MCDQEHLDLGKRGYLRAPYDNQSTFARTYSASENCYQGSTIPTVFLPTELYQSMPVQDPFRQQEREHQAIDRARHVLPVSDLLSNGLAARTVYGNNDNHSQMSLQPGSTMATRPASTWPARPLEMMVKQEPHTPMYLDGPFPRASAFSTTSLKDARSTGTFQNFFTEQGWASLPQTSSAEGSVSGCGMEGTNNEWSLGSWPEPHEPTRMYQEYRENFQNMVNGTSSWGNFTPFHPRLDSEVMSANAGPLSDPSVHVTLEDAQANSMFENDNGQCSHQSTLSYASPPLRYQANSQHSPSSPMTAGFTSSSQEIRSVYEPYVPVNKEKNSPGKRASRSCYGNWEVNDILAKQYPPLFHSPANVMSAPPHNFLRRSSSITTSQNNDILEKQYESTSNVPRQLKSTFEPSRSGLHINESGISHMELDKIEEARRYQRRHFEDLSRKSEIPYHRDSI